MPDKEKNEKRKEKRHLIETEVAFHTENDVYIASSVNISGSGIMIVTEKPLDIRLQITENGKLVEYDAQLVWARVKDDGTMEYGIKY